jgi:flagellin-like protein
MKFKELFTDDDAVSPVIGVILMVAITVILAAVIGTFVLGLGEQVQENPPSAQWTFEYTDEGETGNDILEITHDGGEPVEDTRLTASVEGAEAICDGASCDGEYSSSGDSGPVTYDPATDDDIFGDDGDTLSAGDSFSMNATTADAGVWEDPSDNDISQGTYGDVNLQLEGATVRIIWTSDGGGNSDTLRRWDGPEA